MLLDSVVDDSWMMLKFTTTQMLYIIIILTSPHMSVARVKRSLLSGYSVVPVNYRLSAVGSQSRPTSTTSMERPGSHGNPGGNGHIDGYTDYVPTEVYPSEDELMADDPVNSRPVSADLLARALRDAERQRSGVYASSVAVVSTQPNQRRPNPTALGDAGPTAMPNSPTTRLASGRPVFNPPSVAHSVAPASIAPTTVNAPVVPAGPMAVPTNASVVPTGPMAVPMQQHMGRPITASMQTRSAASSDPRGNTLYVQQVLQQIQQNPDPRIIENLAETLHRSKVENLEHELHAQYTGNTCVWKRISKEC